MCSGQNMSNKDSLNNESPLADIIHMVSNLPVLS